jgi:hypothetical protein
VALQARCLAQLDIRPWNGRHWQSQWRPESTCQQCHQPRIALELKARRPEIPLLVVEGRGTTDGLAGVGLDLSGLKNLHRMSNTPNPPDF